jgi:hypothetical protein
MRKKISPEKIENAEKNLLVEFGDALYMKNFAPGK